MPHPLMKWFTWEHLPPNLQAVSRPIAELAQQMDLGLLDGPEKTVGLRKLLEAKDCLVRAVIEGKEAVETARLRPVGAGDGNTFVVR